MYTIALLTIFMTYFNPHKFSIFGEFAISVYFFIIQVLKLVYLS